MISTNTALEQAHAALAYGICSAHEDLLAAGRAIRAHPECRLFREERRLAAETHRRLKYHLGWLAEPERRVVRQLAAGLLRRSRGARPVAARISCGPLRSTDATPLHLALAA